MRRLIWGFAGRTYHIVWNLMHWLNLQFIRSMDIIHAKYLLFGIYALGNVEVWPQSTITEWNEVQLNEIKTLMYDLIKVHIFQKMVSVWTNSQYFLKLTNTNKSPCTNYMGIFSVQTNSTFIVS